MGKFYGPGYVRLGPATAGCFGTGCLIPLLSGLLAVVTALFFVL